MISAVYSSNVYKDKDEFYESISIDMKRPNERTGFAVIFFRQIEQQCFGYDENDVFMVTPDEWSYSEVHHHKLHNITRNQITKKLNEITTLGGSEVQRGRCRANESQLRHVSQ